MNMTLFYFNILLMTLLYLLILKIASKISNQITCDHGMMLMSEYDDAHVDAMLMINMQANTRSVTALPPYKNLVLRFERHTIFHKMRGKLHVNNLPFPKWHPFHFDGSIVLYKVWLLTTTEHAFGHLPKMNNNLGPNSVQDKNIFSPGWWDQPGLKVPCPTAIVSDIGRGDL